MARKIENWIDKKMPDPRKVCEALAAFSDREMTIVACAFLDALLADLIASSLRDDQKEVEEFVGMSGDGRAPLGTLGSRIQAAYLLRLIDRPQRDVLRLLKDIRNLFSHHVSVSFGDERVVGRAKKIYEIYRDTSPRQRRNRVYTSAEDFKASIEQKGFGAEVCSGLYVGAASLEMKRLHESCRRRLARRRNA
jgi:DNA-binding MltR family transcriptional regulator